MDTPKLITNILKVADIDSEYLSEPIIKFLGGFIYYEDTILSEHIYSVADAIESDHFQKISSLDQWTLNKVHEQMAKEECAYMRVVYQSNAAVQDQEKKRLRRNLKSSGLKLEQQPHLREVDPDTGDEKLDYEEIDKPDGADQVDDRKWQYQ